LIQKHPHSPQFDSWWVKLADFGITKKLEGSSDVTTAVIGTVGFMAPELFHGSSSRSVDHMAADIWALGALTYFTLTKEHIFPHTKRLFQYEEAPDTHFPNRELDGCGVSQEGQAFLRALMKPEPSDRPNTVEASRQSWVRSWMPHEPEIWDAQSESVLWTCPYCMPF
jgi:serine/threonine protein kinase